MSVLSNSTRVVKSSSVSKKGGKSAKESSMKNTSRVIVRCINRKNAAGAKFRAWYLGVRTEKKFHLTKVEIEALHNKFHLRPANEEGVHEQRAEFHFHGPYAQKKGEEARAWYWLADVTMVTPAQVRAWTTGALKKAPGKKYDDTIVDETPATKVARSQKPAAKKVVKSTIEAEYSIA